MREDPEAAKSVSVAASIRNLYEVLSQDERTKFVIALEDRKETLRQILGSHQVGQLEDEDAEFRRTFDALQNVGYLAQILEIKLD